jgi:hypothetical protein
VIEASERLAVGQLQPPLGALQRLDVGLFIHRQDHGVFPRLQVERDDVGGLLCKGDGVSKTREPAARPWSRSARLAAARRIRQPCQAVLRKAAAPLADLAGCVANPPAAALLLSPSATARIICARNASRRSVFPAVCQDRKVARCSLVNATSAALIPADYHVANLCN